MKKIGFSVCLVLLLCIFAAGLAEEHTIEVREYPAYIGKVDVKLTEPVQLYFLDEVSDLPFMRINDMAEIMYFLYHEEGNDSGFELSINYDGEIVKLSRENDYHAEFDFDKNTITFDDFNAFLHNSKDTTLIDLVTEPGFDEEGRTQIILRDKEASFDRYGDVKTFDLDAYGIDLILQDGEYYIPLQTINDILFYPGTKRGFLFNGEALFLAGDDELWDQEEGKYTDLADLYYSAPTAKRSEELSDYTYYELCLVLDNFYGLKEPHDIKRFAQTFYEIGFDEALASTDPTEADKALKEFLDYYLDDLHSGFNEFSSLAGVQPIKNSNGLTNRKYEDHAKLYRTARENAYPDGCPYYEEVGNTAYVTFDSFDSDFYGQAYYAAAENGEDIPNDTLGLIIYAHSQITREGSPIENVVLDLSCNRGGAVDAAVFVLGWFMGDAPFSVKDMSTGAMSTSIYRADVNLDRSFDEKDTVVDKNLYCLISPVSFSCGNLVPAALKSSQRVTLLGKTAGGGSCVVQPLSTASGAVFQISSAQRMSFLKNGSFYDIDQGVEPDYYIDRVEHFYDRNAMTDYINHLF